jgi:branched-chain amino acid transport system ATP-binding protein
MRTGQRARRTTLRSAKETEMSGAGPKRERTQGDARAGSARSPNAKILLDIKGLEAGYGALRILKGVDIALREGDLAVIIGPNGSGKSTTVKSVFALTTRFAGSILFDGHELTRLETHEIVKLGISYVPQGRLVFDTLTVAENLAMGGYDLPESLREERTRDVLALFPQLVPHLSKRATFLSGGQQQMLSVARALMRRPRLLLLDEPSLGLDPKTQKLIFATVKDICARGTTVMMVEQNAHHALAICTKAYVVENGEVVLSGGPEIARQRKIQDLYLGGH